MFWLELYYSIPPTRDLYRYCGLAGGLAFAKEIRPTGRNSSQPPLVRR
jgi:hypothetical protein